MFNTKTYGYASGMMEQGEVSNLNFVPYVAEEGKGGSDIFSRMLKERVVFLCAPVTDQLANVIVAQLLYLEADDPNKKISMYINSPGGSVTAGMAIYDTMNFVSSPVETVVMGQACSMGAFLLAAGEPGMRKALPHSRVMIHQPLGGYSGQATDIEIHTREILGIKENLNKILAENTGQDLEKIKIDTERDYFMSAYEANDYGLVDEVYDRRKILQEDNND